MKGLKFTATVFFMCLLTAITIKAQQHQLVKLWETDSVLKVPESVLYDADRHVLYTSNIDGTDAWAMDGKGSIGKVGTDGKVMKVDWITGLNAPKGLGTYKGKLYVADITDLVVIDIASEKIEKRISVPGAEGLNDVTVSSAGDVYVSDSKGKKVYRIHDGNPELFIEKLNGPNGVLIYNEMLYVLDAGGLYRVNRDKSLTKLADGMEGGADGVEHISGNAFIVSCWQGVIWYIRPDGSKQQLLDTRNISKNSADIGIDASKSIIYVPTFWRNTITAYQVK